jgi:hypothetical protein
LCANKVVNIDNNVSNPLESMPLPHLLLTDRKKRKKERKKEMKKECKKKERKKKRKKKIEKSVHKRIGRIITQP